MTSAEESLSVRVAFQKYDQDGSGSISAEELCSLVEELGGSLTEEELNDAIM